MKLKILTIVILLVTGACSSNNQMQSGSRPTSQPPWFCHQTPEGDDWKCERSDSPAVPEAASKPVPGEPVPVSDESQPPAGRAQPPPDDDSAFSSSSTPTPSQSTSFAASASATSTTASTTPSSTPRPSPAPSALPVSAAVSAQASVPDHIRLAYRPQTPVPLLDLPPTFYAAQLTALSTREALEQYALERGLSGLSGAPVASNGRVLYALFLGIYESREIAQQAISGIELSPAQPEIWLRSIGSLQQAMREALAIMEKEKP